MKAIILAVEYLEPEYQATREMIEAEAAGFRALGNECEIFFVDRKGVGSLAGAYNHGFRNHCLGACDYVWMVSNVTVDRVFNADHHSALQMMVTAMEANKSLAGIHPAFQSDHEHLRPLPMAGITPTPFIEFTAPIIRASIFKDFPLDERMPYWGHDLDWGKRIRDAGYQLAVDHSVILGHTYIRFAKAENKMHAVTRRRLMNRRKTDKSTEAALVKKWGRNWREILYRF